MRSRCLVFVHHNLKLSPPDFCGFNVAVAMEQVEGGLCLLIGCVEEEVVPRKWGGEAGVTRDLGQTARLH